MTRSFSTATLAGALVYLGSLSLAPSALASPAISEARKLLEDWQLEAATERVQQLLVESPDDPEVWNLAGHVQHQRGEHRSALALFDAAREAGVETDYVHLLAANSAAYSAYFESLETDHFIIRYLNKDEIVAQYAAPVLEATYKNVGRALEFRPAEHDQKIIVEIYPNARGLADATGLTVDEIETSGTIAVCKYHRLMITSPLATAGGYGWADTIAHEFVHLVVSKKSLNSIPIWLHEGIAKFYESVWKGPAGKALSPFSENLLAKAAKSKTFITFQQMHPSMAKLPSQEDAALAFAEVFTTIEFLNGKFGDDSISRVLELAGEGVSLERALKKVFKMNLSGIEAAWRRWIVRRPFTIVPGAKPRRIQLADSEESAKGEAPLDTFDDRNVHDHSRLGELLQLRGHVHAAVIEYEKAYERGGLKYPTLIYRLARAYVDSKREEDAVQLLEKALAVHPDSADNHLLAGRVRFTQKNYGEARRHFEAVRLQNPFNPEIHLALAALYRAEGDEQKATQEERFLALARKPRPTRVYELPAPPAGESRLSLVPPRWGDVRIDGDMPIAAPLWNWPVPAGKHTIEFIAADGTNKTADIALQPGEARTIVLQ